MSKLVKNITKDNVFHRDCECEIDRWLMSVTGETDALNPSGMNIFKKNQKVLKKFNIYFEIFLISKNQ